MSKVTDYLAVQKLFYQKDEGSLFYRDDKVLFVEKIHQGGWGNGDKGL